MNKSIDRKMFSRRGSRVGQTGSEPLAHEHPPLIQTLREDLKVNGGWSKPGFHAIAVARLGAWAKSTDAPTWAARPSQVIFCGIAYLAVRTMYGIELPHTVTLGHRVKIAHQSGIVVHPFAVIGDDCILRQGVSLGAATGADASFAKQAPRLGKAVSLGAGVVVVGRVNIGDGVTVGPNATVMTHIPAGATVLAQPPRIIRRRNPPEIEESR